MVTVTRQDMVEFIQAQPDDRKVDFADAFKDDECGCVMVHYGREKGLDFNDCGINTWHSGGKVSAKLETGVLFKDFRPENVINECTYGEIKKHLGLY